MTNASPRNKRKSLEGWVVSDKMDKTRVIEIRTLKQHGLYKKVMQRSARVHAHDEKNQSKAGDKVRVMETRPLSKLKRWRITDILVKV